MIEIRARTGIHTNVNNKYRISSIYRNWGIIDAPDACGWETILWVKWTDNVQERIVLQEDSGNSADRVVKRHATIFDKIIANNGEWIEEAKDDA